MRRVSPAAFVRLGVAVAVALVVFLAPNANPNPDGLEKVAADQGFDAGGREHSLAGGPLADYGVSSVENRFVGTWVAGLLGLAVTFVVGAGIVYLIRRTRRPPRVAPPVAT